MPFGNSIYKFAEETNTNAFLRQMLGGYELVFSVRGTILPQQEARAWLLIHSARIAAQTRLGKKSLGIARPTFPIRISQSGYAGNFQFELPLLLSASQLSALEDHRDGGDIDFALTLIGRGGAGQRSADNPEHQELYVKMPQSGWVQQLNASGAKHTLLLEVPIPIGDASPQRKNAFEYLRRAQQLFVNGLYGECVAECRKAAEELQHGQGAVPWAQLPKLEDRKKLGKQERLRVLLGAMHLYSHLAAHSASQGGTSDYSRADAKLVLSAVAAFVMHESAR